ncbi:PAS domain-containing protein [Paenibacillus sonchi]|uniref:PAS domain-containing protein n=2 Tax=Paenibacillus sonchi TaxID=373687 RepID=A0A974SDE3_9BACL|nr:PAS domain-containing protein [Paenibacillus sonchi]
MLSAFLFPALTAKAEGQPPQNVLVLHSYQKGFVWTDEQSGGIEERLKGAENAPVIYTEYMDWKRYPSQENLRQLYQTIKLKYHNIHVDAIITTDDAALSFALKYRQEILDDAPIIFSGVNELGVENIPDKRNITGVIEKIDPTRTIQMALQINPSIRKVYVVFDNSESGLSTGKLAMDQIASLNQGLELIPLNRLSSEQIVHTVSGLSSDSIVLMTTYYSDSTGRIIEFERFASELGKSSRVPVYHLYDFALNHGAFGGSLISGKIQGQTSAELALRILQGERADELPVVTDSTMRIVYDYNELRHFGIPLNKLPEGSEIINKPFSFYETYRTLVLGISAAFAVLVVFILLLLFYVQLVKRMRSRLEKSNERFSLAAFGSDAVIWDVDMSTMIYYFSDSWYELLGYERGEVNESHGGWREIVHPEDAEQEDRLRTQHLEGRSSYYYAEYRMRSKSGNTYGFRPGARYCAVQAEGISVLRDRWWT